jgi:hypothetical protein
LRIILGQTASRIGIRFPALENVGGPHVGVRNGQFYSEKNKIAVYNRTNHHILVLIRAKVLTWLAPNESATAERVWENLYSYEVPLMGFAYREKPIKTDERELFYNKIIKHGFQEALNLHLPTWSPIKSEWWQMFNLKLDWFLVKDLEVLHARLGKYISDHKAIQTELKLY